MARISLRGVAARLGSGVSEQIPYGGEGASIAFPDEGSIRRCQSKFLVAGKGASIALADEEPVPRFQQLT